MKKYLLAFAVLCGITLQFTPVDAAWYYRTNKQITLTVTVTPSPVAYRPFVRKTPVIAQRTSVAPATSMSVAYEPFRASDMIASTSGTVPAALTVQPDPNYGIFHIVPHTTTFNAGYGPNSYLCAYEVFASETYTWQVSDWVYGSNTTGGGSLTTWPTNNYPTPSALQWYAEGISTAFTPFANAGTPGESPFSGAANTTKQVCFDLSLNVANTVAAGTYQTTIQYNLRIYL